MSQTVHAQLSKLPPLEVGKVFTSRGSPHIFRVVAPNNWVERFTGTRAERRAKMAEWRAEKAG